jgi:hypothetical protein
MHWLRSLTISAALCGWLFVVGTHAQAPTHTNAVITPVELKALLDAKQHRVVVLEAIWAKASAAKHYRAGHLPGAVHLNTDELENGYPRWHLRPMHELQRVIGAHGNACAITQTVGTAGVHNMCSIKRPKARRRAGGNCAQAIRLKQAISHNSRWMILPPSQKRNRRIPQTDSTRLG